MKELEVLLRKEKLVVIVLFLDLLKGGDVDLTKKTVSEVLDMQKEFDKKE